MELLQALVSFADMEGEMSGLIDEHLASAWQDILRDAVRELGKVIERQLEPLTLERLANQEGKTSMF